MGAALGMLLFLSGPVCFAWGRDVQRRADEREWRRRDHATRIVASHRRVS